MERQREIAGNPEKVLAAIDQFGYDRHPMMNIGGEKGSEVEKVIQEAKPKVRRSRLFHNTTILPLTRLSLLPQIAIELGCYLGYSAIRFSRLLNYHADSHYYSFEMNPLFAAISTKVVELAGLKDRVT